LSINVTNREIPDLTGITEKEINEFKTNCNRQLKLNSAFNFTSAIPEDETVRNRINNILIRQNYMSVANSWQHWTQEEFFGRLSTAVREYGRASEARNPETALKDEIVKLNLNISGTMTEADFHLDFRRAAVRENFLSDVRETETEETFTVNERKTFQRALLARIKKGTGAR
jgi:hypothetical protein